MKTFKSIQQAAEYIKKHNESDKHNEMSVNDCIMFGLSVYAYRKECAAAGICKPDKSNAFYIFKNYDEVLTLLAWLQENDGYLYAA